MTARTAIRCLCSALVLVVTLAARPAQAAGIVVNSLAEGSATGACTLRDAIASANTDIAVGGCTAGAGADTITFSVSGTITLTSQLEVATRTVVTIDGTGQAVTISGGDTTRVLMIRGGAGVQLESLTISHGSADQGGAINTVGGSPPGSPLLTVNRTTFSKNHATNAGGAIVVNGGLAVIANSTFEGNTSASLAGAVFPFQGGQVTVTNSTFSGNSATEAGGGIFVWKTGTATVTNSTFAENTAARGGAINFDGTLNIANTILTSSISGGDCFMGNGTFTTLNATGVNLISDGSCDGSGALTGDAHLTGLIDNGGPTLTRALTAASTLAIDAGDPTVCTELTTDQRGIERAIDGDHDRVANCDLGAVEAAPPSLLTTGGTFPTTGPHPNFPAATQISDRDSSPTALTFTVNGGSSATQNGITVSDLRIEATGLGRATVTIACGATSAVFRFAVTDAHGFSASDTETIAFTGSAGPPVLSLPSNIVATLPPSPVATSMPVTFSVTATGGCGGPATVTTTPASGSLFPVGTTVVAATATDAAGNTSSGSFTVTVGYPSCGISVTPETLTQPYLATAYLQLLGANAGGSYAFSITDGVLPPGLQLASVLGKTALIGIPRTPGTYTFTITAAKSGTNCRPPRTYTVVIPPTVVPLLTCVQKINKNTYRGTFGYENSTGAPVSVPVGTSNYFTPGAQNRGQVTTFAAGTVTNAFSVTFTVERDDNDIAVWFLRGPDNQKRLVTVTKSTYSCQ